jgi:DNA helicase-2/ATP-dependent DNA helicase PcrA
MSYGKLGKHITQPPDLSPAQRAAVEYGEGPLLIGAGAGSGKTRTLTQRVIHLINKGIPPGKILTITFTNKAADEIKRRIYAELPPSLTKSLPFLGTFHSFGARILREEAKKLGRTANFTIFDDNDSLRLLKRVLEKLDLNIASHSAAKVARGVSRIKTECTDLDNLDEVDKLIFQTYERDLKKQNAFDFDDLIEKPVRLFESDKAILEKHRSRHSYILIDEFQDINRAEYLLVKLLAGDHRNLNVVGDDNQSIYSFRGADFRNFLDFEKDWPETKVINLGENYRSSGAIVRASYGVIKNNKFQRPKKLWTTNDEGSPIKVIATENPEEEAETIAQQIELGIRNYELNEVGDRSIIHNSSFTIPSIAVLYRTNAQSRALESALSLTGISYEIYGGLKFYERAEIKDIISAVRYATNPKDEISLNRLRKTFRKIIAEELSKKLPVLGKELTLLELIGFFINTTDYQRYITEKFENAEERLENVRELLNFAGTFENTSEFLEHIALLQDADSPARRTRGNSIHHPKNRRAEGAAATNFVHASNKVKLMTIHLAKGLEFDRVFLVGATEGVLPHQRSFKTPEELEEERRLMYVAMTRAKKELTISFYGLASRFLYEMPPELIEFIGLVKENNDHEIYI